MTEATYRLAVQTDLPAIIAIYNKTIPSHSVTADLKPVTVSERQQWFDSFDQVHHAIWVIEQSNEIVGWLSLGAFNRREAYQHTLEVSVYLDARVRGQHLGSQTLVFAEHQAKQMQIQNIVALVFGHNKPSQGLFTKMGYEKWGHLPRVAQIGEDHYDLDYFGKAIQ